ncbi:MAG: metal ABC transporter permease [Anaerolineaceae bacterium]|nr:metal ABC transporter permease [Anaerolineaceae bacterium]
MIQEMLKVLQYEFMQNALLAGMLVSVACGIIGTYVVLKRIVFLSGGIAHTAYGGVGLGYFFGIDPLISAALFSLLASFGMGAVQRRMKARADTIIGVMWAIGMAIGIIFVDLSQGYKADLMSYLFGSILAVSEMELFMMLVLDFVIILLVTLFFKELMAISFDETYALVRNIPVDWINMLLVGMIGLTVVMMMRIVGLIMVIALLTIPPAISNMWVKDMKKMMIYSVLLSLAFTFAGLWLSYFWNLTSGATIILVGGTAYLLSLLGKSIYQRGTRKALILTK